jgi:uncharacterized glyoxalase superfamily protein PhnB
MFYRMAGNDLTKMDAVMNMPLMEFFNYSAMLKNHQKNQVERLNKAAKQGFESYMSALVSELL